MSSAVGGGELGGDDHLVSVSTLGHPFADPFLRLFILIIVGTARLLDMND